MEPEPPLFSRLRPLITSLVSLSQVSLCPFPRLPVFITSCLPVLLSHFPMPVSHLPACLPSLFLPSPCISVSLFSVSRLNACLPACLPFHCLSVSLSFCFSVLLSHVSMPVSKLTACLPVFRFPSPYLTVSRYLCLPVLLSHVSMTVSRLPVSLPPCISVSRLGACLLSPCLSPISLPVSLYF